VLLGQRYGQHSHPNIVRRLKSGILLKNNSNVDLTLLIEEGKWLINSKPYQKHHPKIWRGHESEQEEHGQYQRYGEVFSLHSHFDGDMWAGLGIGNIGGHK
jgi:hypothetical protein